MKVNSLCLENYRCFEKLKIDFDEQLTALVGINGSGKTAILDALSIFLKMYVSDFVSSADRSDYPPSFLKHGSDSAILSCIFDDETRKDDPQFEITVNLSRFTNTYLSVSPKCKFNIRSGKADKRENNPFTTVVYYSSKRILDDISRNHHAESEVMHAFNNAFNPQIDFSSSLTWFIEKATQEALEVVQKKDMTHTLPDLSAVRAAVSKALGEYDEPFIGETPPALFVPKKGDSSQVFRIEELSDGYRTMLALVMDLARRMAVANKHIQWPAGETVLHSPGIVLIDEVELHLHPSWQQTVLPSLMEIFPRAQFIVTTHSPQVLTSIAARHIRVLKDGGCFSFPEEIEGAEAGRVLEDVFEVTLRPKQRDIVKDLNRYEALVHSGEWASPEAQNLRTKLEARYGDAEPMLKKLDLHIENSKWERGL